MQRLNILLSIYCVKHEVCNLTFLNFKRGLSPIIFGGTYPSRSHCHARPRSWVCHLVRSQVENWFEYRIFGSFCTKPTKSKQSLVIRESHAFVLLLSLEDCVKCTTYWFCFHWVIHIFFSKKPKILNAYWFLFANDWLIIFVSRHHPKI